MNAATAIQGIVAFALTALTGACASAPPPEAQEPIALDEPAVVLDGQRYLEYRVGATIAAEPEVLWALLTDAGGYPQWNSTVISIDGTIAAGEEIELRATIDPERTFELTVSTFDENRTLVWEDGGKAFKGVRTFTLTPRGDGATEFRMAEVFTGSMMGMIEGKLPDFRPAFDAFAADLQRTAQTRADARADAG
ncbi:SRPBCC family protein [Paraliomyxa miuraensis]|uniref:SRPBCC family protein n=1 Tax=Paraliomyxa miuraensis TaxID=376150 RepID=UPI0022599372|nr:SRPBCC family protein [Paraliomyxa miuraensis]MCX4239661.1 SRPBCC family protein [Paraliomyxa miuraensis]